jgi:hypothetical protein
MNLETMRPETPSEDIYPFIIKKAALTEPQRLQAFLAFDLYRDHRAALLQEQAETIKALQTLLGGQQPSEPLPGDEARADAPALQQGQHASSAATDAADARVHDQQGQHASTATARAADTVSARPDGAAVEAGLQPCTDMQHPTVVSGTSSQPAGSTGSAVLSTLDLESAEQAEQLLLRLQRNIRLQREFSRRLVYLWMDLLTTSQHVDAILAAYLFSIKIPAGEVFQCFGIGWAMCGLVACISCVCLSLQQSLALVHAGPAEIVLVLAGPHGIGRPTCCSFNVHSCTLDIACVADCSWVDSV